MPTAYITSEKWESRIPPYLQNSGFVESEKYLTHTQKNLQQIQLVSNVRLLAWKSDTEQHD
jgi:hypothetical protein